MYPQCQTLHDCDVNAAIKLGGRGFGGWAATHPLDCSAPEA